MLLSPPHPRVSAQARAGTQPWSVRRGSPRRTEEAWALGRPPLPAQPFPPSLLIPRSHPHCTPTLGTWRSRRAGSWMRETGAPGELQRNLPIYRMLARGEPGPGGWGRVGRRGFPQGGQCLRACTFTCPSPPLLPLLSPCTGLRDLLAGRQVSSPDLRCPSPVLAGPAHTCGGPQPSPVH